MTPGRLREFPPLFRVIRGPIAIIASARNRTIIFIVAVIAGPTSELTMPKSAPRRTTDRTALVLGEPGSRSAIEFPRARSLLRMQICHGRLCRLHADQSPGHQG